MAWDHLLHENGAYSRCESQEEKDELQSGYADHLMDQDKDRRHEEEDDEK